jgi:hypothetical protein
VLNPRRIAGLQKRLEKYGEMILKKEAQRHAWQDKYSEIVNYVGTYTHRANRAARQANRRSAPPPPPPSNRSVLPNGSLALFDPNNPNYIRKGFRAFYYIRNRKGTDYRDILGVRTIEENIIKKIRNMAGKPR